MKKIILFVLLLLSIGYSQYPYVEQLDGYSLFKKNQNVWADSVRLEADSMWIDSTTYSKNVLSPTKYPYPVLWSVDTLASTILSDVFTTDKGNIQISVYGRMIDSSGTANAQIDFGVYRGAGFPDSTGWEWYPICTATSDTTFQFNVANTVDNPWAAYEHFHLYRLRIVETGVQKNGYVLNLIRQRYRQ